MLKETLSSTARSPNFRTRSSTWMIGESGMVKTMTNDELMTKLELRCHSFLNRRWDFIIHFFRFSKSSRKSDAFVRAFRVLDFVIRHSCFVIAPHALKKKTPVRMAFITNITSNACTTEEVVA